MNEAISDRQSALDEFAAAGAPKQELLPAIIKSNAPQLIHGAQQVAVKRDRAEIFRTLSILAAAAGEDWYYRWPVKDKGKTKWVEGASIKLANDLWREYGSCDLDTWVSNEGIDYWEFSSRFIDLETGASMTRLFRQNKMAGRLGGEDSGARNLDIAYQIGQSKAIRNTITNALQTYADFAFKEARKELVNRVGQDIEVWRKRSVDEVGKLGIAINRVEAAIGRPARDWLAPDIAMVVAMIRGINDGMATVDETFPKLKAEAASTEKALDTLAAEKKAEDQTKVGVESQTDQIVQNRMPEGDRSSSGQAAASVEEPPAPDAGAAAALREEATVKLLDLTTDENLSVQERSELLENILLTWEDKLDPVFFKALSDNCAQVLDGRIRRSTAVKRLEELP